MESVSTEDELAAYVNTLQQEVTEARILLKECHLIQLNNLLHKMERHCYEASLCILDIADLVG